MHGFNALNNSSISCSFVGLPAEADWPSDVALPLSSFRPRLPISPHQIIPEMEGLAADFLLVIFHGFENFALSVVS